MTLNHEQHVRSIIDDRLRDAEHRRLVKQARATRGRPVRVWALGSLVVAWRPRKPSPSPEIPFVLWV